MNWDDGSHGSRERRQLDGGSALNETLELGWRRSVKLAQAVLAVLSVFQEGARDSVAIHETREDNAQTLVSAILGPT